ncbi:MAG: DUF4363 family protein [Oscillospiraceae bacterium]|nr:DUF4363 family protein [Oscillospiraceae bacterium]
MKQMRLMIAGAVMAAVIALTMYSVIAVQRRCEILLRDADAVTAAAEQDTAAVRAAISALEQDWAHECSVLRLFIPAETLAELNRSVSRLAPLIGTDGLEAELSALRATVIWIAPGYSILQPPLDRHTLFNA